jgi:hypothetical protein
VVVRNTAFLPITYHFTVVSLCSIMTALGYLALVIWHT